MKMIVSGWMFVSKKGPNPIYEYYDISKTSGLAKCKLCNRILQFKHSRYSTPLKLHLKSKFHVNDGLHEDYLRKKQIWQFG